MSLFVGVCFILHFFILSAGKSFPSNKYWTIHFNVPKSCLPEDDFHLRACPQGHFVSMLP